MAANLHAPSYWLSKQMSPGHCMSFVFVRYLTRIPLENLFRFNFFVHLSSIKSYNNTCKVFRSHGQGTGKRKHKEPPINPQSKKFS